VEKITRGQAVRVGVDLAKRAIQVHAVDAGGRVLTSRALARDKFIEWCVMLAAGCVVAMEASSSAHHWARKLIGLGLDARIISAQLVSPYRSEGATGKNDANDAAAICEAASRPTMRFIPVKSIEQQSMLCVHRVREGIKEDRTACISRIRGLLGKFGLVFPKGAGELQGVLSEVLEDAGNELGALAWLTLQRAQSQWHELDQHLAWCDERIAAHAKGNEAVKSAATLLGIGPVTASAVVATVGDFKQFKNGAQFGAWIGLTDAQAAFERGQEHPGRHHQTGRHLPAHAADPGGEVGGDDGAPTTGQDLPVGGGASRALGLAEGGGGAGQQERTHPVGRDE